MQHEKAFVQIVTMRCIVVKSSSAFLVRLYRHRSPLYNGAVKLSVVIPAFNEAHRIKTTLETVIDFCKREASEWEIIVVDDGSQDGTARAASMPGKVQCLRNEQNRGKGYSVRRGMLAARLDPVLFTDADLSTPIEEALPLYAAIKAGADIAISSRKTDPGKKVQRTARRRLMAAVFRLLVKALVLRGFHDTQCGFKMFRQAAARLLLPLQRLERWSFDVELLYLARRNGLRVAEVPVNWQESSESRLKLTTPLAMVRDLLRVRFNGLLGRYPSVARERSAQGGVQVDAAGARRGENEPDSRGE